ncbi:hypothetical protein PENTCL1PPCAC_6278, partial [Pristionchus entomophagus]
SQLIESTLDLSIPMDSILNDASHAIGNTPLVYLRKIGKDLPAKIAVKLEYMNPTTSVKDRAAFFMIDAAEKKGLITPGKSIIVEATSGNLGIALAFNARIKGFVDLRSVVRSPF